MKRICLLVLICIMGVIGCSKEDKIPKGILSMQEMRAVLMDMQMADAYNHTPSVASIKTPAEKERQLKVYYAQILQSYHTGKEKFLKSYHFYEDRPDLMKKVYQCIQDSVDARIARIDNIEKARQLADEAYRRRAKLADLFTTVKDSTGLIKVRADNVYMIFTQLNDSLVRHYSSPGSRLYKPGQMVWSIFK